MARIIFIASSVLLGCVLLLWLAYTFLFREKPVDEPIDVSQKDVSQGSEEFSAVLSEFSVIPLLSPKLSLDGEMLYGYHAETAALYAIDTDTKKPSVLLDTSLINPIVALWSNNPKVSILKTSPQNGASYHFVNVEKQSIVPFAEAADYMEWDGISEKVVFIQRESPEEIVFFVANPDGTNVREIIRIPERSRITMSAISGSPQMAYWAESSNVRISPLFSINIGSGTKNELFAGKYGTDYLFSPNGERILMSWAPEKNGPKLTLAMINKYGGQYVDLGLPTLVSKCAWNASGNTLYCAVPTGIPETAVMPDDYKSGKVSTTDVFWKVNVETGEKERLIELADITQSFDAQNVLVSLDERRVYFSDRKTGKVFEITL
jgi:hypothetical protein